MMTTCDMVTLLRMNINSMKDMWEFILDMLRKQSVMFCQWKGKLLKEKEVSVQYV